MTTKSILAILLVAFLTQCTRGQEKNAAAFPVSAKIPQVPSQDYRNSSYYYQGQRVTLRRDLSRTIIKAKNGPEFKNFLVDSKIEHKQLLWGHFEVAGQNLERMQGIDGIKNLQSFIVSETGEQVSVDDEIIIKPKSAAALQEILRAYPTLHVTRKSSNGVYLVTAADSERLLALANAIFESDKVEYSSPNFIRRVTRSAGLPDDQYFPKQYYLGGDQGVLAAWQYSTGKDVKIAIIDTGVPAHEDLAPGTLLPGVVTSKRVVYDGHGLACAGIVAAAVNNKKGICGIAPNAKIIPIAVDLAKDFDVGESFLDADSLGADIISCSWNYGPAVRGVQYVDDNVRDLMKSGRRGLGSIIVASSGNDGAATQFPATLPGVISVGAVDKAGNKWDYSGCCNNAQLLAQSGEPFKRGDVVTLGPGYSDYDQTFGGTSAACPQVAGLIALMLRLKPQLKASQILSILKSTGSPEKSGATSARIIDFNKAVLAVK